jgi:hypothetical protein
LVQPRSTFIVPSAAAIHLHFDHTILVSSPTLTFTVRRSTWPSRLAHVLALGETRNHVLSAKLCRQAPFPRISGIRSLSPYRPSICPLASNRCLSLLFRQLRPEGTHSLQMARESRPRKGTTKTPRSLKRKRTGKAAAETKSVDINDEDYNIRSSQSTQLLTPTEGTSKAPEKRGKGKTTAETESVDINDEDYNIRSPERTQLLTQIKRILNDASVLSAFWACCQLADMNCLQELATSTSHRKLMTYCQKPLSKLLSQCELLELSPN